MVALPSGLALAELPVLCPLPPVPAEHDRFCLAIRLFYFDEGLCSRLQSPLPRTLGTDAFALTYCI